MAVKKWRGRWTVDLEVDGKRIRRVSPVQTKRGAREFEDRLRLELAAEAATEATEPRPQAPLFAEFAQDWLTTYAAVYQKPSTWVHSESALRNRLVPFFGNRRLDEIDGKAVEDYKLHQQREGLNNGTINTHLTVLHKLMVVAQERGHVETVARMRLLPYRQSDFDWLRPTEVGPFLDAARSVGDRWYTFFLLAIRTGLRKGELYALHWSEVDFEGRTITVKYTHWRDGVIPPKGGRTRVVPMSGEVEAALRAWREKSPGKLVFPGYGGQLPTHMTPANDAFTLILKRAGLRHMRVHDLRHTFASHLVLKGCSLRVIQLLLGHHSVVVTERYAHVSDDQLTAAVNVLDGLGTDGKDSEGEA
ncbi:MAG: site-specific integrase [Deltaproteobacteria bacterium]|nr:site-specific integrase [Deltaproteobacteria bacterium]